MTILNAYYNETNPFISILTKEKTKTIFNPKQITKNDVLILWGGEDIATELYNEKPIKYSGPWKRSHRDITEEELFNQAIKLQIPIIGVCRGAQLITALTGGKLAQHIENHRHYNHIVYTTEQQTYKTNSCHHQMMIPTKENTILSWAEETSGLDNNNQPITHEKVPELVYFPSVKALGIQGHIEWPSMPLNYRLYLENKIKTLLLNE